MRGKFHESERAALFIDGANLYSAARALGFDIDYRRLLKLFRERGHIVRAYYYTALVEGQEYSPIRPMLDWLAYNGFAMITKPAKEFTDALGRRKIKGNMDIELAIDVLEMAEHLDHVILFSGDGDFRRLVEAVQRKGLRVSVVSTVESSPPTGIGWRRTAPPGRRIHRAVGACAADRAQSVGARAAAAAMGRNRHDANDYGSDARAPKKRCARPNRRFRTERERRGDSDQYASPFGSPACRTGRRCCPPPPIEGRRSSNGAGRVGIRRPWK